MINTNLLNEILHEYDLKRNKAILMSDNMKAKAYEIEEYQNLDKQERFLIFEIGKLKFEQQNTQKQAEKLAQIQKEKKDVLKKNSIDFDALNPNFECKKCNDTGYLNGKMCSCLKQAYNDKIMGQSNIDFENISTLNDYDYSIFDDKEKMQEIVESMKQFVNNFDGKIKNIVFVGATGTGKTYLAKSIAKEIMNKEFTALFVSSFNLNNAFLKIHTSKSVDKMLEIDEFLEPDLLIIDDLGTEPILKNVTKEYLLVLLSERVINKKSTIFTTNLIPTEILDKYDERLFSRMFDKSHSLTVNFGISKTKDLRIKKNKNA